MNWITEKSVLGQRWQRRPADDRQVLALAQSRQLPEVLARLLVQRGITNDQLDSFLTPRLRTWLPDPFGLKDMDKATRRLAEALERQEKIAVFADYDVDGATSSALLIRYMRALGNNVRLYVPDRMKEGYGPNPVAFQTLKQEGCSLCAIVDCGTTAFAALEEATRLGLDVVVLDHHVAEPRLPPVVALINPNRLDETFPIRHVAAVGVTFLTLVALNKTLRERGFFAARGVAEPGLLQLLDLVAIGTVCDVMPLTDLNRAWVSQGLKVLAQRSNIGLAALADIAGIDSVPDTYHIGFILGPRINAGGRVGRCDLGARLLSTEDPAEARALALELDDSNTHRKTLEADALAEATGQALASLQKDNPPHLLVAAEGWHQGIIGIIASRLKDRFKRPTSVVTIGPDGLGKGSGRSVRGVDLGSAIIAARQAGFLSAGGGHAMAAGFSVRQEHLSDFQAFMNQRVLAQIDGGQELTSALDIDGVITVAGATVGLMESLSHMRPFGAGNPEPCLALLDSRIAYAHVVGERHVSCTLTNTAGQRLKAIAFRALETPLGEALLKNDGRPMHLAGQLRLNHFQGAQSLQLFIEDAAFI